MTRIIQNHLKIKLTLIIIALIFLFPVLSNAQTRVSFAWQPNIEPDIAGYKLFHRLAGGTYNYASPAWKGSATTCSFTITNEDVRHYFVLRAFDKQGFESQNSDEACFGCSTDSNDTCPDDPDKTRPGICGCGVPDIDSDGDGTLNCNDLCPDDPEKIAPGANGCGFPESSNNPPPEDSDNCPNDPDKTEPGICGCGVPDDDRDGDGRLDCKESCPDDPYKIVRGLCGCGTPDIDTDKDGTLDCNDSCPNDPNKTKPGVNGCGFPEDIDHCPNDSSKVEPGVCGCGIPDVDSDGDGSLDCNDRCPDDPDKVGRGVCGCGTPDIDTDRDGSFDCNDSCPNDPAKTRPGENGCGTPDSDNDENPQDIDNCPDDPEKTAPGICGCGVPDDDRDGDGKLDCKESCPDDPDKVNPGICGCGQADIDTDDDGVWDCNDSDDDNDGISDRAEAKAPNQGDANHDGIPDSLQCNVGSIKTSDKENYISLESSDGTCISGFKRVDELPSGAFPEDIDFIYGLYEYIVRNTGYGKSVIVTITLPKGASPDTLYIFGPTSDNPIDHWYEFLGDEETGAEIDGNIITLFLTDGKRGDNVLTKDRMVANLGAPGHISTGIERDVNPGGGDSSTSSSGESPCFIGSLPK